MLYRLVKIKSHGRPADNYHVGMTGFVPVDAAPGGDGQTVPVYLAMSCPMGFEPERLEDTDDRRIP